MARTIVEQAQDLADALRRAAASARRVRPVLSNPSSAPPPALDPIDVRRLDA